MIKEVKTYMCNYGETPSKLDIEQCRDIARKHNCVVELHWHVKYSGDYTRFIYEDSDIDEIFNKLPKCYGI